MVITKVVQQKNTSEERNSSLGKLMYRYLASYNPAFFEFYIPQDMVNVNEVILRIQLLRFRAYSRAVRGSGGTTQSTTDGGGTTQTTTQQQQQTPTTSQQAQQTPTTTFEGGTTSTSTMANIVLSQIRLTGAISNSQVTTAGDPPHTHMLQTMPIVPEHGHSVTIGSHSHTVTIPPHQHTVTIPAHGHSVTIPNHSHSVTIPNHSHTVTIDPHSHSVTIPDHTHEIEFGIFQGTTAQSISIRVDNNTVPLPPSQSLDHIDARPFLRTGSGGRIARGSWHRLEIVPDQMTRVAAWLFMRFTTNSRGGGIF